MSGPDGPACWDGVARTEHDMERVGAQLAGTLRPNAAGALRVHLSGQLGAGKTTLARGLLRALGVTGAVRSPSYALVELHEAGAWRVLHVDLYRLADPADVAALGLADFDVPGCLWLVEWAERAAGALPEADLSIHLGVETAAHPVRISAATATGREWLNRFKNSLQAINFA